MTFARFVPALALACWASTAAAQAANSYDNGCSTACTVQVPDGHGGFTPSTDSDCDGWLDADDNCDFDANASQADFDTDGVGDVCDGDDDNDGFVDGSDACQPDSSSTYVDVAEDYGDLNPSDGFYDQDVVDGCPIECVDETFADVYAGTPTATPGPTMGATAATNTATSATQTSVSWAFGYLDGTDFVAAGRNGYPILGNFDITAWQKSAGQNSRPRVATSTAPHTIQRNIYPTDAVQMQPGSVNDAAVQFTATELGLHDISATFSSGRSLGAVDAIATVYVNGVAAGSGPVLGLSGSGTSYTVTLVDQYLHVDDTVVFAVNRNGGGDVSDTVLLDAVVFGSCVP